MSIYLLEKAAASTDKTNYLQFWVKNTAPNTLMYTDEGGVDMSLAGTYEWGTWTPQLWDASNSNAEGQTYGPTTGTYMKIGNFVVVCAYLNMTSIGTLATIARIGNLPYTIASTSFVGGHVRYYSAPAAEGGFGFRGASAGNTYIDLYEYDTTTGMTTASPADIGATGSFSFTFYYFN